jgi:hypothetical protein
MLLAMVPLAYAHDPMGTPKNYCEPQFEWSIHDWNSDPPSTRFSTKGLGAASSTSSHPGGDPKYQWPYMDGNHAGDCDGSTRVDPGVPCLGTDPADPINSFFIGLCDSDVDPPISDYDGHKEFGYLAHALILVSWGSYECWHEDPHHTEFGYVWVDDVVLGAGASFTVNSDFFDATGLGRGCGDFEFDTSQSCVGSCVVSIPAGIDGAYHVVVTGSQGHVYWP